jgi:hypothetical protein
VLEAPLGGWACCPTPVLSLYCCEFSSLLYPCSPGQIQPSNPPLLLVLNYSLLFIFFSFVVGEFSLPRRCTGLCSQGVGRRVVHVLQITQAALEPTTGEKWCHFSQCGAAYGGFPWVMGP